jgi:hypothetical protein
LNVSSAVLKKAKCIEAVIEEIVEAFLADIVRTSVVP